MATESTKEFRQSPLGRPQDLTDAQRLELREFAEASWNGASVGGTIGFVPSAMCYYWYRHPQHCPQWVAFSKPAHVMAFSIGSIAIGTYFGTLCGMIVKYYRVKKYIRENVHSDNSETLDLNQQLDD